MKEALEIYIKGLVQGVGFRPFVYRIAIKHQILGWVENRNNGVIICAEGDKTNLNLFCEALKSEAPPASAIESISSNPISLNYFSEFKINKSENASNEITRISPDIAVCPDCLEDIKNQENRILYPFTNCTNCGPRFTIIKDLPYDRENTTMNDFEMCGFCRKEYEDVLNRRFHAQPVACNHCGPKYQLVLDGKAIDGFEENLNQVSQEIESGKIIAVKSLGGFNLMCDALSEKAVNRLRSIKQRDGKPFAVMFRDLATIKKYAELNDYEKSALLAWQAPIVLLNAINTDNQSVEKLSPCVCNHLNTIGAFLPYLPFQHLLFSRIKTPAIVLTSGNLSEEPIVISNEKAIEKFSGLVDSILIYNREIYNRTDDSVVSFVNNQARMIRRSRGYVPAHVKLKFNIDGILATGAELSNCFAVGKEDKAYLSQHIGDLKNLETYEFYKETFYKYLKLFRIQPVCIAADLHPDYFSSQFAEEFSSLNGIPLIKIQHHHAHIASGMAENGLDEKVIGVAFDGTGLGTDGNILGSEFLVCDYQSFQRIMHFEYIPLPGGDKSNEEPWRIAVSLLYKYFGNDFLNRKLPFLSKVPDEKLNIIIQMIDNKLNCPLSSGAGRLFDAMAAMFNICTHSTFHAEAPMRLESLIDKNCKAFYNFQFDKTISFLPMFIEVLEDIEKKKDIGILSAKFHNTMINCIFDTVVKISEESGINKAVLSGGVFQNRYLLGNLENLFDKHPNIQLFTHKSIPSGDGGIALGQLAIAAKQFNQYA